MGQPAPNRSAAIIAGTFGAFAFLSLPRASMAAIDYFPGKAGRAIGYDASADDVMAVTPDDANDLTFVTRQVRITGAAGNLHITNRNNVERTFAVLAADVLNIRATRIWATGTTCTGIVILA